MAERSTVNPTIKRTIINALLAAMNTDPGEQVVADWQIHLFTSVLGSINPDTVPTDFTEALFTGYAATVAGLPTLGPVGPDGNSALAVKNSVFVMTDTAEPQTVNGYYVTRNAGADLVLSEQFAVPVPFAAIGDYLDLFVAFPLLFSPATPYVA